MRPPPRPGLTTRQITGPETSMARWLLSCALLLALLVSCAPWTRSTVGTSVSGQIMNPSGIPLVGLEVVVVEARNNLKQVLTTDAQGRFTLTYLLDDQQHQRTLEHGQKLKLSVWTPGYEAREVELRFPGGRLRMEPLILQKELEDTLTGSDEDVAPPAVSEPPQPGRTGRGD